MVVTRARSALLGAAASHARLVAAASRGDGYVGHLYMLRGIDDDAHDDDAADDMLFQTAAWEATRRGGKGQDLKIGFMPIEDDSVNQWEEGGFLIDGEKGVYVHCSVFDHEVRFSVSARPEYALMVCEGLAKALEFICHLLERKL
jgi:hypothetical protein